MHLQVVAPSTHHHVAAGCVEVLPSLFDFQPERYGLQPFQDLVAGLIPVDPPWCIKGEVVKGFGRGSRQLGIPTANLSSESLQVPPPKMHEHAVHTCV